MKSAISFFFSVIFIFGLQAPCMAKKLNAIDSLETELQGIHSEEELLHITQDLAWRYLFIDPDTAFEIAQEELYLAQLLNNKTQKSHAYNTMGISFFFKGEYREALIYYNKALEISIRISDTIGISKEYNNIALIYSSMGYFPKAIEYILKDLSLTLNRDDRESIASSYNNLGNIYVKTGEYEQATEYYHKSLALCQEINDSYGEAKIYNNLGIILEKQGRYAEALQYYMKAVSIDIEADDQLELSRVHTNIAGTFLTQAEEMHGTHLESTPLFDSLLEQARTYYEIALISKIRFGDKEKIANTLSNLGKLFTLTGEFKKSEIYLDSSLNITRELGSLSRELEAHEGLCVLFEQIGEHKKAFYAYKNYSRIKDSLFNETKSKDIGRLEAQHEFETAEAAALRVEGEEMKKKAEAESRRNNLQYSIIVIIIVGLAIGIIGLGRINISTKMAEGLIFFTFLLFFEFTLVLLDPYIEQVSGGAPAFKLAFNAILAAMIFPLHSIFETRLKSRLMKE